MLVVSNSSPLIALAQIEQFHLLHRLFGQITIPNAVREEVISIEPLIGISKWLETVEVKDKTAVGVLRDRLDKGESEAIILALEQKASWLLMDEIRGRRIAQAQGLNPIGTLGILILAKQGKLIADISPLLDQLLAVGFRMDQSLYQTAKRLAGE